MNWAIVIPVGIGTAVLLSIALVAIGVSGQISRKEEADEVRFYWDSMLMYSKRASPDAPPDYEVKTLYENRKDFCAGCSEYNFCRAQQSVLSNLFRWGMSRSRKSRGWTNELPVLCALHTPRPAYPTHRFQRSDL